MFIGRTDAEAETPNTLATSCEELTHWKRPWCSEGLGAGGEGDGRGWDGWMASLTRWTWVWVNSDSWWWTGRSGMLWFMGSAKSRTRLSDWTELTWSSFINCARFLIYSYLHFRICIRSACRAHFIYTKNIGCSQYICMLEYLCLCLCLLKRDTRYKGSTSLNASWIQYTMSPLSVKPWIFLKS